MKTKIFLLLLLTTTALVNAQQKDFELRTSLSFTKSETLTVENLAFQAIWDDKLSYSDNIGYYGGIAEMRVFKDNQHLQTIKNIEDGIALGKINFEVFDYNMDGYLDFTVPIDCGRSCNYSYYLYNSETKKFEHRKEWDYLRIQRMNKDKKQIISQPDGMKNNRKNYQVDGLKLIEIKK
ncbi:XAC2610-related protein [Aequorivita marina]|uniref:XAC2610-related protein n=1 Tax=Aequorivita marina TaxID=3073654 RepID=UPI0028759ED5|nr:hypothetical protein [Aequorivita sp. S2608]MDS1296850.1 hypothetical protein [Aequorivita sp. S2608]